MAQGTGVGTFALHRVRVQPADEATEERDAEQLRLRHELERPRRAAADDGRIQHAHVICRQEGRALPRDVLGPDRPHPEEQAEDRVGQQLHDPVEHARSTSLAISSITSSIVMPLEST
jgi:hypothetical protein